MISSRNKQTKNSCGSYLAMHKDAGQIQLNLETHIHISPINSRTPPKGKPSIRNLIQATPLRIGQLLVLHRRRKRQIVSKKCRCREAGA